MKLTERDKKLLIGLGIFIFVVVFIRFLLFPKIENIKTLKADINTLNNSYASNMINKAKTESIDSDVKILSVKLKDLRAKYPPTMDVPQLLVLMKYLCNESKLEIASMQYIDFKPTKLEAKDNTDIQGTASSDNATTANSKTQAADTSSENQGAETASADATGTGNGQPSQQQNVADNITNSKILKYFYQLGLKSQFSSRNYGSSTDAEDIPDGKGYSVSIKVEAKGTNKQIKTFLDNINKLGTRTYCKTASITELSKELNEITGDDGKMLKLSAEIVFYGIMDKAACGYYVLPDGKWTPMSPSEDKTNLFKEYSGYETTNMDGSSFNNLIRGLVDVDENSERKEDDKGLSDYDFSIVSSAFGGGMVPSVSICCKNPKEKGIYSSPVVYGDNKGVENAEIFIEEKAGKYYCKIKTDHESYPDKKYSQTFEFVPRGKNLKLIILSSERGDGEDKAGVNISIINNTDKDLTYLVKYDDEKSPRVKIGKTVGSVRYEK